MTLLRNVPEDVLDLFWNIPEELCFVVGHICCRVLPPKPIEYRAGAGFQIEREHTHDVRVLVISDFVRRFR